MSGDVQESILKAEGELAVLAAEFQIQLLNCSSSGCLMETNSRLNVGTFGTLRLQVDEFPAVQLDHQAEEHAGRHDEPVPVDAHPRDREHRHLPPGPQPPRED